MNTPPLIHPTAIIHSGARLDPTVSVGPYAVIDEEVTLGPGCRVGPHVYMTGRTVIGADNRFHAACVIGDAPQDLKYNGEPTALTIGNGNVFREHVTVHRSSRPDQETVIGSNNLLMAGAHVGHNCHLGNHIIMANGSMLGGHVILEDKVFMSGNAMLHQFVRVGTLALIRGGSGATKDVPPYTVIRDINHLCGLNIIGLRRAGLKADERLELKRLYRLLFRSRSPLRPTAERARAEFQSPAARRMIEFVTSSTRGVCTEKDQTPPGEFPDDTSD